MKHLKILAITLLFGLISCNSDDDANTNEPAENSIASYTGVIVGSSGHYTIEVKEEGSTAIVVFDDTTYTLTTDGKLTKDEAIENLVFSDETISLALSTEKNGLNPTISFTIPEHDIVATIHQKLADITHELYTGVTKTFYLDETLVYQSTFNIQITGDEFEGYERTTIAPTAPSLLGSTDHMNGSVTRTDSTLILTWEFEEDEEETLTFNIDGNTLKYSGSDEGGSFEITLTLVE